jgi:riboflavin kinase/FMN adenylyltransferase
MKRNICLILVSILLVLSTVGSLSGCGDNGVTNSTVNNPPPSSDVEAGEVEEAAAFLGHRHCLTQTVQHGYRVGRTIGVPTVNLIAPHNILTPARGVYVTRVYLPDGRDFAGVTNIGTRPTVSDSDVVSVETFLLDFDGDLYDQRLRVEFCRRLRGEKKFDSLEALRDEIRYNAEQVREYFRNNCIK